MEDGSHSVLKMRKRRRKRGKRKSKCEQLAQFILFHNKSPQKGDLLGVIKLPISRVARSFRTLDVSITRDEELLAGGFVLVGLGVVEPHNNQPLFQKAFKCLGFEGGTKMTPKLHGDPDIL